MQFPSYLPVYSYYPDRINEGYFKAMERADSNRPAECLETVSVYGYGWDYTIKTKYGGGTVLKPHKDPLFPNAPERSKRVFPTYNCTYCEREVSIETTVYEEDGNYYAYDESLGYVTSSTYPTYHWLTEKEANDGIVKNCTKYCFAACFNSFVGWGLCSNNCNNSCTGSTSTPSCDYWTAYNNTSSTGYSVYNCGDVVNCLQQCVGDVGTPCYWCVNDTSCNGCVYNCTTSCANATDNFPENCHHQATKGLPNIFYSYCRTCNGMTGNCNHVCNNTTACTACTAGCTTECTVGCYSSVVKDTCYKSCNTNCFGLCTESCTCGCTVQYYSGCGNSSYSFRP